MLETLYVKKHTLHVKKREKTLQVMKKYVPLQRFNKAIDCLTKNSKQNEEVSFHVRSYGCNFFRFLR